MGIGSAAAAPYGNGGQLVDDLIGPAYATVKVVADNIDDLIALIASTDDLLDLRELITTNLTIIQGSVAAASSATTAAQAAAAAQASIAALMTAINTAVTNAQTSATNAAASALAASNIAGANFLPLTGGTVTGPTTFSNAVTFVDEVYDQAGWNNDLGPSTKNAVRDKIEAILATLGAANGIAQLDGSGKVPTAQLPDAVVGALKYQGTWNATTNTPAIPAASASNRGFYYVIATAGTTTIGGINDWVIGDWLVSDGTNWSKIDNTDKVSSVNGQAGAVVLAKADVGLGSVDNTADTAKPVSTAQQAALDGKAPKLSGQSVINQPTVTPTFADDYIVVTGQAQGLNIANPTGTAEEEHGMSFRFKDNGTARTITWGNKFRVIGDAVLPSTTVPNKWLRVGAIYNLTDTKWDIVGVLQEV